MTTSRQRRAWGSSPPCGKGDVPSRCAPLVLREMYKMRGPSERRFQPLYRSAGHMPWRLTLFSSLPSYHGTILMPVHQGPSHLSANPCIAVLASC